MEHKSLAAVDHSTSLLDRVQTQNQTLTEAQALTDGLVSVSIQEGTNLKTAAAMLGAGWVGRFTRVGAMTSLPSHAFVRWASYVPARAAESAAFAGIERGFHPSTQPFHKDWARAAVTLTGLKAFGGMSRGQNIVLQHLFTDLGLVGGHHAAYAVNLLDKPQGSFAQQMLQAEATNWHMKGSMAFAHSFSSRLSAMERALGIFLESQETGRTKEGQGAPFFSQLAMVANGERGSFSVGSGEANEWTMASKKGEGAGEEPSSGLSDPKEWKRYVEMAKAGDEDARKALSELDVSQLRVRAESVPESIQALLEVVKNFNFQLKILVKNFETPEKLREVNEAAQKGDKKAAALLFVLEKAREKVQAGYDPALTRESFWAEVYEKIPEAREYFPELGFGEGPVGSSPSAKPLTRPKSATRTNPEKDDDPLIPFKLVGGQATENPLARMENVDAIKRWDDRGAARSALNQVIENDPEPLVQDRAAKALVSLGYLPDLGVYEGRRLKTIEKLRGQGYQMTREFKLEDSDKFHDYLRSLEAEGMEYRTTTRLYPLNISVPFFNEPVLRNPPPEIQVFVRPKNAGPSGKAGRSGQEDSDPPTSSRRLAIPSWHMVEETSGPQEGPVPVPLSQVLGNLMQRLSTPAVQAEVQGLLQEWARTNAGQRERLKLLAQNPEANGAQAVEFILSAAETGRLAKEPLKTLMDEMHQKVPGTEDIEFLQVLQIFDLLKDSPRLGSTPFPLIPLPNDLETDRKLREWLQPWKATAGRAREGILGQNDSGDSGGSEGWPSTSHLSEGPLRPGFKHKIDKARSKLPVAITLGALKVADGFTRSQTEISYIQVTDSNYRMKGRLLVDEGYRLTNSFSTPTYPLFVEYRAGLEKRKVDYKVLALEGPKGSESELEYFVFERS